MAAIPDIIKIKLEVDTTELDIAVEKAKELEKLLNKMKVDIEFYKSGS
ncbi:MAG: hypothetical protein E6590_17895 [Clostridiales bacterium]|nr:hypothetical protein [Clostridiales bacterium]